MPKKNQSELAKKDAETIKMVREKIEEQKRLRREKGIPEPRVKG